MRHPLEAQSHIERQLVGRPPAILHVDAVLPGVVLGGDWRVERLHRIWHAVPIARHQSGRKVRHALVVGPIVVAVELVSELQLMRAGHVGQADDEDGLGRESCRYRRWRPQPSGSRCRDRSAECRPAAPPDSGGSETVRSGSCPATSRTARRAQASWVHLSWVTLIC